MLYRRFLAFLLILLLLLPVPVCARTRPVIGIAWRSDDMEAQTFFWNIMFEEAGASTVPLGRITFDGLSVHESGMLTHADAERVKQGGWRQSNAGSVMQNVDAVFFSGGEDISPTLLKTPQPSENNSEPYCAARDVSDYLLMNYCLDNDIPLLAVCRGMQMLAVASGGSLIQDLGNYCAENGLAFEDVHRMPADTPNRGYARHDVQVTDAASHFGRIVAAAELQNVASWHHQAVTGLEETALAITGVHQADGLTVIEAVERTDKRFAVGVQFHPEVTCSRVLVDRICDPCDFDTCLRFASQLAVHAIK